MKIKEKKPCFTFPFWFCVKVGENVFNFFIGNHNWSEKVRPADVRFDKVQPGEKTCRQYFRRLLSLIECMKIKTSLHYWREIACFNGISLKTKYLRLRGENRLRKIWPFSKAHNFKTIASTPPFGLDRWKEHSKADILICKWARSLPF